VAVVALQLLLGLELGAVVRQLLGATLAVLAGAVGALVDRALGPAPDALAHTAVELVFRGGALRHQLFQVLARVWRNRGPWRPSPLRKAGQYSQGRLGVNSRQDAGSRFRVAPGSSPHRGRGPAGVTTRAGHERDFAARARCAAAGQRPYRGSPRSLRR